MTTNESIPLPLPADGAYRLDAALFLDIDGTLAEIAPTPDEAIIAEDIQGVVRAVHDGLDGALAFLSGRAIADIDRLFPGGSVAVAGLHGLERRIPGNGVAGPPAADALPPLVEELTSYCAARDGLILEDKGKTVALHYRQRPDLAHAVMEEVERVLDGVTGVIALEGKMVVEIKPEGWDKGSAIRAFMAEPPFAGRWPMFLGDDVTDEAGFAAARALGGLTIRVGEARPSRAQYRLPDVPATHDWLRGFQAFLRDHGT